MASDIWLRTIQIVREETCCGHIGYSLWITARVLLYTPSHRQDSTYHGLCYPSHGTLAGTRNSSMGSPHEGSIRRPIAPWANALTTELHLAPLDSATRNNTFYRQYIHSDIMCENVSYSAVLFYFFTVLSMLHVLITTYCLVTAVGQWFEHLLHVQTADNKPQVPFYHKRYLT